MIKAWSKCHIKNGEEHEYKRQPTQVLCDESLLTQQPTSTQPFDFGRIGEVQGETTETVVTARRERGRNEGSNDLVQSSGDIVYLASDASSCEIKLYVLQQDVTTATKKARRCRCVPSVNFQRRGGNGNQCLGHMRFLERKLFVSDEINETNLYIINLTWSVM